MRKNGRQCLFVAIALFIAGCATDVGDVTGSIAAQTAAPKPLLPAPPPPILPDKPRMLAEPECRALISQMSACTAKIKDTTKKAAYQRRTIEVAETLSSMEESQRKATCKTDLPHWRKDCGVP